MLLYFVALGTRNFDGAGSGSQSSKFVALIHILVTSTSVLCLFPISPLLSLIISSKQYGLFLC
jgi:hypothetical protein